ncbi:MAG: flagellar biosynthesis/type III secretory pathway protein [Lachnospiraceae bacterium]|nr:flagellar biosynthesis/type III secretory pathway protein [Lachnospiraceae bacterium]
MKSRKVPEAAVFPRVNSAGEVMEGVSGACQEDSSACAEESMEGISDGAGAEAYVILEDARKEAEELLADAGRRAEEEFEAAREAGYRAGYNTGYEESRRRAEGECRMAYEKELLAFQEDMKTALQSVEKAKERCLKNYLDELKDCAIAIGEKVIQISLRSSGEVIRQMIISATEKLKKTAWVKIYIDKSDYDMMMEADADIIDELSHLSDNIKFIVMDKEDHGNCIIEMPEEIVDVSVNTQMENIKDILENVRV